MGGRFLLDTTVAIAVLKNDVSLEARRDSGAQLFLSSVVLGELFFGAEKSRWVERNLARIERLASLCPALVCDEGTARHYGTIKNALQRKGRPIPENDLWIAAAARQHGMILATRDRHFEEVEDLATEVW